MNPPKILFLVECYWGSGHMNVTAEMARAFQQKGADVTIAASDSSFEMGRMFDYGAARRVVRPGLRRNKEGKAILSESGAPIESDEAFQALRRAVVMAHCDRHRPDAVIVEGWPFGLNRFDSEYTALLGALRAQGLPVHGVARDVLGYPEPRENPASGLPDYPYHDARSVALANACFDTVFVAGDPRTSRLEDSLDKDAFARLKVPHEYIGYFAAGDMPQREAMPEESRPVLITGGGTYNGAVRTHMRETVSTIAAAKPYTALARNPLMIVIGAEATESDLVDLQALAKTAQCECSIIRTMPSAQFRRHVANAALVVSKGGRNATVECAQVLRQGPVGSIITPMRDETGIWPEARVRAQAFAAAGLSVTLEDLAPANTEANAALIERALAHAREKSQKGFVIDLNGAHALAGRLLENRVQLQARPTLTV